MYRYASKDVCHINREWLGVALLDILCDGYDSGSCFSGRILNVTRRVDMVLGHPREDALVDTCLREDRLWHQMGMSLRQVATHRPKYITASILHGAAPIIISSQPSSPSRTTTTLGSSPEAYFLPFARPSRHSRRHKPPSWHTWQHRRVQQVRDHEQRPLATLCSLQTVSAPLRPL
jgi:hypothetical protein